MWDTAGDSAGGGTGKLVGGRLVCGTRKRRKHRLVGPASVPRAAGRLTPRCGATASTCGRKRPSKVVSTPSLYPYPPDLAATRATRSKPKARRTVRQVSLGRHAPSTPLLAPDAGGRQLHLCPVGSRRGVPDGTGRVAGLGHGHAERMQQVHNAVVRIGSPQPAWPATGSGQAHSTLRATRTGAMGKEVSQCQHKRAWAVFEGGVRHATAAGGAESAAA